MEIVFLIVFFFYCGTMKGMENENHYDAAV